MHAEIEWGEGEERERGREREREPIKRVSRRIFVTGRSCDVLSIFGSAGPEVVTN
jgi:hypothetical protein